MTEPGEEKAAVEPGADTEPVAVTPEGDSQTSESRTALVVGGLVVVAIVALGLGIGAGRMVGQSDLGPEDLAATIAAQPRPSVSVGSAAEPDTGGIAMGVVKYGVATVGSPAPDFTLPSLTGEPISLSDYRGKPVLLNFFATWCMPCAAEMPHLQAAYEDHADEGLVVLGVDYQETAEIAAPFMSRLGLTFPAVVDESGDMSWTSYEVGTLPTSVLIDRDGDVALISEKYYASREDLEADLRFILPE